MPRPSSSPNGVRTLEAASRVSPRCPARPAAPAAGDFAAARGRLPGRCAGGSCRLRRGRRRRGAPAGLVIAAAPRALVTAPWPGDGALCRPAPGRRNRDGSGARTGLSAGPRRAGHRSMFGPASVVEAGAALGLMGGRDPGVGIRRRTRGKGVEARETLYVELRTARLQWTRPSGSLPRGLTRAERRAAWTPRCGPPRRDREEDGRR
jgi:hypothetical protein